MPVIDRLNGLLSSVAIKAPCLVATTANITLDGQQTIDGVAVVSGNRVLVWNQTDPTTNGIYVCDTGVWGRDSDFKGNNQVVQGTIVAVMQGTQYGSTVFQQTTANPVIGSTAITFAVSGAAALALASAYFRNTLFPLTTAAAIVAALGAMSTTANNSPTGTNDFTGGRAKVPTRTAGDNGTDAASTAFVGAAVTTARTSSIGGTVLRSYIAGLTLSAAGATATFGIAAGVAADSTNTSMMALTSAFTKTTAAWAVGTGSGALDTGAIANSTWYHVHLIAKADLSAVDVLISLSATAPTMPATYTLRRRIGSIKTDGSGNWLAFSQNGDEFLWLAPPTDVNAVALGTASTLFPLSVPPAVVVNALIAASATGGNSSVLLQSPAANTQAVTTQGAGSKLIIVSGTTGNGAGGQFNIRTDTSGNIRAVASVTSVTFSISTDGWRDRRGQDA